MSLGQSAGLVENDDIYVLSTLQYFATLDQHAKLRASTGGHHNRGRHRQPHGARTRDDEDAHGGNQPAEIGRRRTKIEPDHEGGNRERDDHGNEDRGDAVREPLNGGLRSLSLLDQAYDLREYRVASYPSDAKAKGTVPVECRADHPVSRAAGDRHRLTGEH